MKSDMDCNQLVELVTAYLDGSLDSKTRARFDEHLLECEGCENYLQQFRATVDTVGDPIADPARELLLAATPLVQERIAVLSEAVDLLAFLFVDDDQFVVDAGDAAKVLDDAGVDVVRAALAALEELETWDTTTIESCLRAALVEGRGLKPRLAFGPVRVAVTGRRISPPLFESMELLGRDRSLGRLRSIMGSRDLQA